MKNLLFAVLFSFLLSTLYAQTSSDTLTKTRKVSQRDTAKHETLAYAEQLPSFPGGEDAFKKYLRDSIKYPESAKRKGKEGTSYVAFTVTKTGDIESVEIAKGIPGAPELDAEAVRVIQAMPKWTPGIMNGKPVKVKVTVPIRFTLGDD